MTSEHYERGPDIFRDSEADEDFPTGEPVLSPDPTSGQSGTTDYPTPGTGEWGLDDSDPTPATSDQVEDDMALDADNAIHHSANPSQDAAQDYDPSQDYSPSHSAGTGAAVGDLAAQAAHKAGDVTAQATAKAGEVVESAADKASELKDVALDRGGDVAAVAKDELSRLAHDARSEVQALWSNASGQLRVQATAAQLQLSELLNSLSGELGEMASKSESGGPLTALAKQAAAKGGEWSHWLENSEPTDVLIRVRRFARQRPFVFLASAALAGVVVGRLGRGLMAAGDADHTPTHVAGTSTGSAPVTAGVTTPADNQYGANGGAR
ncbi:MAG: hypothetical protein ACOH1Y_04030 [Propionicimonas sp.]